MEVAAYSTVALTLGLVVARPRLGSRFRVTPSLAALVGVLVMLGLGIVGFTQFKSAALNLWSPFLAIAAIMIMTDAAERIGLLDLWAAWVDSRARSGEQLFSLVFVLGVVTSAALNNDAAVLLLTPLVVALVRRRYPDNPQLIVPFAFAVFASAGVAALPVSNPMNMVVAEFSGIGINRYAMHMVPVAIACWLLGYTILRLLFAGALKAAGPPAPIEQHSRSTMTTGHRLMMILLFAALVSYPLVGFLGRPVWTVPVGGAVLALVLVWRHGSESPARVIWQGVSWDILAFLLFVLILSMGLLEVGLVDRLARLYDEAGLATIGVTSALGSAVLNNHPMSHLNMFALEVTGSGDVGVFAALVGGDLGPRLLPMGSLAGLLWIELLRRHQVDVSLKLFVKVGVALTVPTLAAALAILALF